MPADEDRARIETDSPAARAEHILGAPEAEIDIVEYGDFECPYCAGAAPVLRRLVEESGGRIRLVFRHFPLFEVHPHALTSALAAESASELGLFWAMHDTLFAHQDRLDDADLRRYAEQVGADPDRAVGAAAQRFAGPVQADYAEGVTAGVRGTPSLFVCGQPYAGRVEVEALRRAAGLRKR
ncbi:MAG: disulfide bond formation protein DsbA [Jatrophihabitantaceae bacterium]|nr:disulfide bond formation protein DsbA [Jatrophihabitantaceae bacterium]